MAEKSFGSVVSLIAATLALTAVAGAGFSAEDEADVRIIDLRRGGEPVAWIDNETILLLELTGEQGRRLGNVYPLSRLATYNYRTGERKTYGNADWQACYANGYVSYLTVDRSTGDLLAVSGELGKETSRAVKLKRGEQFFDYASCRPFSELPGRPGWLDEKTQFRYLWPPAGIINCRADRVSDWEEYVKARFHKRRDATGVALPFSCFQVYPGLKYYPFKGAYFAYEYSGGPWPQDHERRAFWLYPDGRVETVVLPYSDAIRGAIGVPTARGIVTFPGSGTHRAHFPTYSVYLVTPEAAKLIAEGNALAASTSPDGCKVAMLHDPEYSTRVDKLQIIVGATLKVLELCQAK